MNLDFSLHGKQLEVYHNPARFKVCSCGRRGGKTFLAGFKVGEEALKNEKTIYDENGRAVKVDLAGDEVWYIAPTFENAKTNLWNEFKIKWADAIEKAYENTATAVMKNGRTVRLKGADRPDTLRGAGLSYVVLDEFAYIKPHVWELIISPMLARTEGEALFIGTPDGKNHMYDLFMNGDKEDEPDWASFQWGSADNPAIPIKEIRAMEKRMHREAFLQEARGMFVTGGSGHFKESYIQYLEETPEPGNIYIAIDPAGYSEAEGLVASKLKKLDETAIAVVEVSSKGWFIHEILHGRWGTRETSLKIVRLAQRYRPVAVGIEKGALKNAISPYLEDQQRRLGVYFEVHELTHGGKNKQSRIIWALQGRFEHGRVFFKDEDPKPTWQKRCIEQLLDFPNPMVHDDLIDALAYIDQLSTTVYFNAYEEEYKPMDSYAGY